MSLDERTATANNYKADLFVSIHANASRARGAQGQRGLLPLLPGERRRVAPDGAGRRARPSRWRSAAGSSDLALILWDMAQAEHLEESSTLASRLQEELAVVTGSEGRGVKQAPFRVLVGAGMPAVLVEVAFISQPRGGEAARLGRVPVEDRGSPGARHRALPARAGRRAPRRSSAEPAARRAMTPRQADLLTAVGLAGLLAAGRVHGPALGRRAACARGPDRGRGGRGGGRARPPAEPSPAERGAPHQRAAVLRGAGSRRPCCPRSARWRSRRTSRSSCGSWSTSWRRARPRACWPTLPAGHARARRVRARRRRGVREPLERGGSTGLPGGSRAELLTVYSLVEHARHELPGHEPCADPRRRPGRCPRSAATWTCRARWRPT